MSDGIYQWKSLKCKGSHWWRSIDPTMDTDTDVCVGGQEIDTLDIVIIIVYVYYYF